MFAGSPNLALVAHELANAETQNDAVPTLMNEVATAEGRDFVVPYRRRGVLPGRAVHGVPNDAAGTWQCPAALGAEVAAHIHDGS